MKASRIKIAIADDHFICRDGIAAILNEDHFLIIGQVNNGKSLVDLVKENEPDIVFLDIQMPILDGPATAKILQKEYPNIKIIALTMYEQESCINEMISAGAKGYILKSANKNEIIESIFTVLNNEMYFSKEIDKNIISKFKYLNKKKARFKNIADLTDTEIQIIKLICDEYTSEDIGKFLFLSKRTIDGARLRIQFKINVNSTAGIVKFAIENGIYRRKDGI